MQTRPEAHIFHELFHPISKSLGLHACVVTTHEYQKWQYILTHLLVSGQILSTSCAGKNT